MLGWNFWATLWCNHTCYDKGTSLWQLLAGTKNYTTVMHRQVYLVFLEGNFHQTDISWSKPHKMYLYRRCECTTTW